MGTFGDELSMEKMTQRICSVFKFVFAKIT